MIKNIRFVHPNMTRKDGYFYNFDHSADIMYQKADDGTLAFAYPLDTPIGQQITSLEFDGESYWTLENIDATASNGFRIRRWVIENFVMLLQQTFTFATNSVDTFESSGMTVERYQGTVAANGAENSNLLSVAFSTDHATVFDLLTPGTNIYLGPSTRAGFEGQFQRVTVNTTTDPNLVTLTANKTVGFNVGDPITFSKNIWIFNQHYLKQSGVGGLYKVNALDGSILSRTQGGAYKDVNACGFHNVTSFTGSLASNNGHYLIFLRTSNLLFIDPNDAQLTVQLSAVQNNLSPDNTTVFTVYDLGFEGDTIFRLQLLFNVNGAPTTETTYNYQLATFRPFPIAIALTATPAIIVAGAGASTSAILATVTDQYALPYVKSPAAQITFSTTGGGTGSSISPSTAISLNSSGQASATYTSGATAGLVTITATVSNI